MDKEIYFGGYKAFTKGLPIGGNPWPRGWSEHIDWNKGWKAAEAAMKPRKERTGKHR